MKRCPTCQRTYDDAQTFCSADATPLVSDAPPAYDSASTLVANTPPPASEVPPTQVLGVNAMPGYPQTDQQSYQPPQSYQQPPQQWTPPQQQQQWGAHQPSRNMNKMLMLAAIGIAVAVGVGLLIYFLTRSGSSSGSPSSSRSASSAYSRVAGTWKEETRPNSRGLRFTDDWKIMDPGPGGREKPAGTYSVSGDKVTINLSEEPTISGTLLSDTRMRVEAEGKTAYMVKENP